MTATTARKQRAITSQRVDPTKPAAIIINGHFHGLTNFCKLTGYKTSTAHGWTLTGFIPARRRGQSIHAHILAVAAKAGYPTQAADFIEQPAPRRRRTRRPTSPPPVGGDGAGAPAAGAPAPDHYRTPAHVAEALAGDGADGQ